MWLYACGQAVFADHIISGPAPRILCCAVCVFLLIFLDYFFFFFGGGGGGL